MKYIFALILLTHSNFLCIALAQAKNDYFWILGYPPNKPEKFFGGVVLDFNKNITSPEYFNTLSGGTMPAVLSSQTGRLLCYTDGCRIYDSKHEIMTNGDSISFGEIWVSYCDHGYPITQSNLILPWPNDTTKAIVFHTKVADDISTYYLLYSIIEFTDTYPNGIVTKKNEFLLEPGTCDLITATKHANGRDWWILLPEDASNRYFSLLLSPEGISIIDTQSIGTPWGMSEWASQTVFTPDGTKYIRANPWKGVDIFNFDRCSGLLSNPLEFGPLTDPVLVGAGAAISLDSRYLYVSASDYLYQFDLKSNDIFASKVLIDTYDGYLNPFATNFYQMNLAPDGKIYIFATNGVKSLHVINNPESKGDSCNFIQHAMELPAYIKNSSVNIPYFRLGHQEGSLCDSLNFDKSPIAHFRYELDTVMPFRVHFKNLSYFEPTDFLWSFGNNTYSQDANLKFVDYNESGTFNVCLSASNIYGQNTFCTDVSLEYTSNLENDYLDIGSILIFPNPANNELSIKLTEVHYEFEFQILSYMGRTLFNDKIVNRETKFDISHLTPGIYFYRITHDKKNLIYGKLLKL